MKTFTRYFLRGVLTLLPLILTIYPLYYFFVFSDTAVKQAFQWLFPDLPYITGTGVAIGVAAIFVLGLLMSTRLLRWLVSLIEFPFRNIPLVKTLYGAIKELVVYLAPEQGRPPGKVVSVRIPGQAAEIIGFVTRSAVDDLPVGIERGDRSIVYIPMSYQVGGFTLFLPRDWLRPVDLSVEEAMKYTLTGWITPPPGGR